ncbi:NAD(P)/FAD-dependent oxidoreductase [Flavobacterium sp.]|uniref:NAD(P)/FAD-dependent oxidoreductase n=1 Tax=Flavobacterium sp. TaxID=239 RepID=UPI0039E361CF
MEANQTVIIAGGGLAGLTAAIHLSKIGIAVTLVDKNEFPKHKVCGEYISNEVLPYLNWLGVNPENLHPAHISKIVFSTGKGKKLDGDLPLGGFGLSRYALDFYLYQIALEYGCQVIRETITSIDFKDNRFSVALSNDQILQSEMVIGAFGKRSNIDQKMHRHFIGKKSPWLAVKGHFKGTLSDDVVGLHNFRGGYCGVSKVENDIINICYLADFPTFKAYKNIDEYQKEVLYQNPELKQVFENTEPIFDKPMTISQISFDKKDCVENHILMIGDTAGLIHPLCGNGMAMAIHSAKIASELIGQYFNGAITSRESLEKQYTMTWNKQFSSRLRIGRWLGSLLQRQTLSEWALNVVAFFPSLLPKIIRHTHGKLLTVPQP